MRTIFRFRRLRVFRTPLAIALSVLLGGTALAQTPQNAPAGFPAVAMTPGLNPDPWEGVNRKLYGVFQKLDAYAIRPAAVFYKHATPRPIRTGLRNGFSNLHEPVIFVNDLFQFHFTDAGVTLGRLTLNSTVGLAGIFDPATSAGLPFHENGFGTTLGRYGTPTGPYLFIPVIGPSDVRDAIGSGIDALTDPLTWIRFTGRWELGAGKTVIGGLDTRANADEQLKQINATATDPYASIRSLYLQNRQAQITGGQVNVNSLPDFGDEPAAAPNQAASPGQAGTNPGDTPLGEAAALPDRSAPTTTGGQAGAPDAQPATAPQPEPDATQPH